MGSGSPSSQCPHLLLLRLTLCIPDTLMKGLCLYYHLLYLQHSHVNSPCDYCISPSGLFSNTPSQWYFPWKLHLYLQSIQISAFSISAWSPLKQSPDKSLHTELIWEFNPRGAEGQGQVKERGKKGRASKDEQSRWLSPWCFWMPLGEHLGSGYQNYTPSGINKKHLLTPSCLHFGVMHLLKVPWAARR